MKGTGMVKTGITVFQVLAWVSLVVQVVVGAILLISGGPDVPIGGVDVPARVVGLLNFVAGGIYFFLMHLTANVLRLVLEIHERVTKASV